MSLKDFFLECNRREVFKRLSIYIVSSWVILQVLSIVSEPIGLPEKSLTYFIIILLVAFPIYLAFLWKSRVRYNTDDGDDSDELSESNQRAFRKMYFVFSSIISIVAALSVFLIFSKNISQAIDLPTFKESNKIAVLNFENNTGDPALNNVGKYTADWLIHGITENQVGEVISSDVITNYGNILGVEVNPDESTKILSNFLNPNKVVTGEIFKKGETLLFNCVIKDVLGTKTFIAFAPITCASDESLNCIEDLRQKVVGYLAFKDDEELEVVEDFPPSFEAYEKWLDAEYNFNDPDRYLGLLNEAISLDDKFLTPKIDKIQYFYNNGQPAIADSLLIQLTDGTRFSEKQENLILYLKSLLDGENNKIFVYHGKDYDLAPSVISANSTQMTLALNYINRPDLVEDIYNLIGAEFRLENCEFCKFRYFTLGAAYNCLGNYKKAIKLLEPAASLVDDYLINTQLVTAYINNDSNQELSELISKMELKSNSSLPRLLIYTGRNYLLKNDKNTAITYFDKVIEMGEANAMDIANAYYFKGDFSKSEELYRRIITEDGTNSAIISRLAVSCHKNAKIDDATAMLATLDSLVPEYDFGNIDYCKAQYFAATGDEQRALDLLESSIAKGSVYSINTFQNDTHFINIKDTPQFQNVLTYWHE